jgi:hypothetical protein
MATNFKVLSKEAETRTVNNVPVEGFKMRVGLAPDSGNRTTVYLFASVAFVGPTDPIAALDVGDVFELTL